MKQEYFEKLPYNTQRSYVAAKTPCGCEVFVPVNSKDTVVLAEALGELKQQLSDLPDMPKGAA